MHGDDGLNGSLLGELGATAGSERGNHFNAEDESDVESEVSEVRFAGVQVEKNVAVPRSLQEDSLAVAVGFTAGEADLRRNVAMPRSLREDPLAVADRLIAEHEAAARANGDKGKGKGKGRRGGRTAWWRSSAAL